MKEAILRCDCLDVFTPPWQSTAFLKHWSTFFTIFFFFFYILRTKQQLIKKIIFFYQQWKSWLVAALVNLICLVRKWRKMSITGPKSQKLHVRNACFQSKTQRKYTIIKCRIVYKKDAHHDLDNLNSCWLALKWLIDRS